MIRVAPTNDSGGTPLGWAAAPAYRGDMTTTETTASPVLQAAPQSATPAAQVGANTLSIVALVLGIVGIVAGQWLLAVAAIVFGFLARTREPQSRLIANWGLALGFVGAFGWILFALIGAAFLAPFAFFLPFWL